MNRLLSSWATEAVSSHGLVPHSEQQPEPAGAALQVVLNDGKLTFSPVINIPHAELHGTNSFVRLRTADAVVRLPSGCVATSQPMQRTYRLQACNFL